MPSDLCTTCVVRHIRYNDIVIVNSVARHKICMKRKSYRIKAKVSRWQLCESEVMCIFVCNCVCVWVLANMSCIKMLLMLQTIICRIGCHTNATTLFQLTRFCDNSFPCVCVCCRSLISHLAGGKFKRIVTLRCTAIQCNKDT